MNWKAISLLPKELVNEDVLLRIERRRGGIIYIVGNIDENGDIYTDERRAIEGFGGFLSRDVYENAWYVNPREIKL